MLDLIVHLIQAQRRAQEELTDEQLDALAERLIKGELSQAKAELVLKLQAERGDERTVATTLEYLAALGMESRSVLDTASEFYLSRRHYHEARRYGQTLCYEHDRYGPALRRLAVLDVLVGDYVGALVHIEEYFEQHARDEEMVYWQIEAMMRSGATTAAEEVARETGVRADLGVFLELRRMGRLGLTRFSWLGRPTRSGEIFRGRDVPSMRRFFADLLRRPLKRPVEDLAHLDRLINSGTYVSDRRQFGHPEVWVHPADFERTLTGDCEDFALWAWTNLCRLNYPARFVIGGLYRETPSHAWVTLNRGGAVVQVLECTPLMFNPLLSARSAIEYRPHWSVDRNLHWYRH